MVCRKWKEGDVKVTSINGGEVALDPNSISEEKNAEWAAAEAELANTSKLSKEDVHGFDAVFLPGGHFISGEKWTDFSIHDGNLVTGHNPMSSRSTAEKVIEAIENPA